MLNIAVIGCGTVAGYGHLPTIAASPRWRLAAVADLDEPRRTKVAEQYGVPVAKADWREVVALPGLHAVVVATHMDTHREIAVEALRRGLHVLCEKPMARDVAECREMVEAARHAGRLLVINFNVRSAAAFRLIRQIVQRGEIGTVRAVRLAYLWSCHQWQPPERLANFMRNGGPIVDSGVHFFDGVRVLTGQEIERVDASGVFLPPWDNPQHVIATCRMSGGAIALVESSWLYCKRTAEQGAIYNVDIVGDDGAISADLRNREEIKIYTPQGTRVESAQESGKGWAWLYDRFADSVEGGRIVELGSGEDGLRATEAALLTLAATKR